MSDRTLDSKPSRSNGPLPTPNGAMHLAPPEIVANEAIARRAYEKFVDGGSVHGRDEEDWANAQSELIAETGGPKR